MDTITSSKTLDITVIDDQMNESTFRLDTGAVEGLSMAAIREVYAPMITGNYLFSSKGSPITAVARAVSSEIITTKTAIT